MTDPRRVAVAGRNLTVVWMEPDGRCYTAKVASMAPEDVAKPLCGPHEIVAHSPAYGIYDEHGVELWPSDCRALGAYQDQKARELYGSGPVLLTQKLGSAISKATKKRKGVMDE